MFFIYDENTGDNVPKNVTLACVQLGVKRIEKGAFSQCRRLIEIIIPPSVESIQDDTFKRCENLMKIDFSACKKMKHIGHNAFWHCQSLAHLILPPNIEEIGGCAFHNCKSITSIQFPHSIKMIQVSAFSEVDSLPSVILPAHTQIWDSTFHSNTKVTYTHWFGLGQYVKMRDLFDKRRAIPLEVEGIDMQILQNLVLNTCDDIFRTVLEMIKEEPQIEHDDRLDDELEEFDGGWWGEDFDPMEEDNDNEGYRFHGEMVGQIAALENELTDRLAELQNQMAELRNQMGDR